MSHATTNLVLLIGRLGQDPDIRLASTGNEWGILSVATTSPSGDGEKTQWHRVKVFGASAGFASRHLRKGDMVSVRGHIDYERWTDTEGNQRYGMSIISEQTNRLVKSMASEPL